MGARWEGEPTEAEMFLASLVLVFWCVGTGLPERSGGSSWLLCEMSEEERALHEEKALMGDDMVCEQGEQEAPGGGCDRVREIGRASCRERVF